LKLRLKELLQFSVHYCLHRLGVSSGPG
jgi:hypothetical protein